MTTPEPIVEQMYKALKNLPCACAMKWAMGRQLVDRQCARCAALAAYEQSNEDVCTHESQT